MSFLKKPRSLLTRFFGYNIQGWAKPVIVLARVNAKKGPNSVNTISTFLISGIREKLKNLKILEL
jgi:hypothetical protein